MNYNKLKSLPVISTVNIVFILSIFFILIVSLISITGCERYELFVPEYTHLNPPPEEVTIEQLVTDYMTDEVDADAKYTNKNILLTEVEVEEVITKFFPIRREGFGNTNWYIEYFIAGGCRFILKDFELMQNVEVGYVLNLVGNCDGLSDGIVVVTDCWAESIVGDLGTPNIIGVY